MNPSVATFEVNPLRDLTVKGLAKSVPSYRALLNFQFEAAPGDGHTNLKDTTFPVKSLTSGESASLKAIEIEKTLSITEPHDSTIASDTGKATTADIKYFTSDKVSWSSFTINIFQQLLSSEVIYVSILTSICSPLIYFS